MSFNLLGTRVEISFWFVAVIALSAILAPQINILPCIFFCILHELGHLSALAACGKKALRIELGYFGMKIVTDKSFLSPIKDAAIAAAGPAVSFMLSAIFFWLGNSQYSAINFALGVFNIMPIPMLDGGRIISSFVTDEKYAKRIGIVFSILMTVLGIITAIYTGNFLPLIAGLYILTGTVGA